MKVQEHNAFPIIKTILDGTAWALLNKCFPSFLQYFHVPHVVETFETSRIVNTVEEFERLFNQLTTEYEKHGTTDLVRNCLEVKFRDQDTILSTHEARVMNGSRLMWGPYPVLSEIKRYGSDWKVVKTSYAIKGNQALSDTLSGKFDRE